MMCRSPTVFWVALILLVSVLARGGMATPYDDVAHIWNMNATLTGNGTVGSLQDTKTFSNYTVSGSGGSVHVTNLSIDILTPTSENGQVWAASDTSQHYIDYGGLYFGADRNASTIELWYRVASGTDYTGFYHNIFSQGGGTDYIWGVFNGYNNTFQLIQRVNPNTSAAISPRYNVTLGQPINATWRHVAFVITPYDLTICVNGTNVSSVSRYSPSSAFAAESGSAFRLNGYSPTGSGFSNNYVKDMRIWNYSRTCANISSLYNLSLSASSAAASVDNSNITAFIYDEDSQVLIRGLNLSIFVGNTNTTFNQSFENGTFNLSNLHAGQYPTVIVSQLNNSDYLSRNRILTLNNSQRVNFSFFLVNTTNGAQYVLTVKDEYTKPVANITVQLLRRFGLWGWLPVEEQLTTEGGEATFVVHSNAAIPYRFSFFYNTTFIESKDYTKFFGSGSTVFLTLYANPLDQLKLFQNYTAYLTTDNASGIILFSYVDPAQKISYANLTISHLAQTGRVTDCTQGLSGSLGILNCTAPNVTGREYFIQTCVLHTGAETPQCDTAGFVMGSPQTMGRVGIFLVALLMIVVFGISIGLGAGPTSLLLISVVGILCRVAGLWAISYVYLSPLLILWLIAEMVSRNQGGSA